MEEFIRKQVIDALFAIYSANVDDSLIQVQETRKEFEGELTIVVFPLLRFTGKSPEATGAEIGDYLRNSSQVITGYNVVKGFLNLTLVQSYWLKALYPLKECIGYWFKPGCEWRSFGCC